MAQEGDSVSLLSRAQDGDSEALNSLLALHRDWLWSYVRRHMGGDLRAFETSEDVVQDVLRKLIQRGPAFVPRDEHEFRCLVATIVLNRLRDRHDWMHAARRTRGHEEEADVRERTHIGLADRSVDRPSRVAARNEEQALVQLALQLIDPEDAHVIRLRNWEELPFEDIGKELGIESNAARMRFNRAVRKLGTMMRKLDEGELDDLAPDAI